MLSSGGWVCSVKFFSTLNMFASCVEFVGVRLYWKTRLFSSASTVLNVNEVTIPNAAPASRSDQKSSACLVADAVTVVLSDKTTVAERRLSSVGLLRRDIRP